jgi:lipopolysaccharide biosynthesis protein
VNQALADYIRYLHSTANSRHDSFVEMPDLPYQAHPNDIKTIAYYLPQYHPFPENDRNWEKGFVEWMRVARAVPQFTNHFQPRMPIDHGYYDLRLPETFERQIDLAKHYAIYGFCFYYYWFSGKRLMEKPIQDYLNRQELDFPFMLCWANESWIRNWDGSSGEVLQEQTLTDNDAHNFFQDVLPFIKDERYIRINNKPVLMLYRPDYWPKPVISDMIAIWQRLAREAGLDGLFLLGARTTEFLDPDLEEWGLDCAVEFPPHQLIMPARSFEKRFINPGFEGRVFDLHQFVCDLDLKTGQKNQIIKAVFTSWDNSARSVNSGTIYYSDKPLETYRLWLEKICKYTRQWNNEDRQFVFINAWNEWSEGAHLEPDRRYGYGFLDMTRNVIESFR